MNIKDVVITEESTSLEDIFRRQKELLEKYIPIERKNGRWIPDQRPIRDFNSPMIQGFIKEEIFRVVVELVEAADCLKNKFWKQEHMETDVDHFYEELIDSFHFLVELFLWIGIEAKDLYTLYMKKSTVNKWRQASGY